MPEHEGKYYRQHGEHTRLVFTGRRRVQFLLDVHGDTHDNRPNADIQQAGNRQVRDDGQRQRIRRGKVFNPADERRVADFNGNVQNLIQGEKDRNLNQQRQTTGGRVDFFLAVERHGFLL